MELTLIWRGVSVNSWFRGGIMHFFRLVLTLSILLLCSCNYSPFGFTDIGEIVRNPAAFEGKEVKVKGTAVDTMKLPLMTTKYFQLRDASGEISVHTVGALPIINQPVAVRGRVENTMVLGETAVGLHLVELERLPQLLN